MFDEVLGLILILKPRFSGEIKLSADNAYMTRDLSIRGEYPVKEKNEIPESPSVCTTLVSREYLDHITLRKRMLRDRFIANFDSDKFQTQ